MVSGWSLMWVASLTLRVYQCESRSLDFTSFQSERWPVLLTCSETAEVWVRTKRISFSCSLLLEGSRVHLSGHNRSSLSWRCPGVLGKIRSNAHRRVLNNTKDRQQRKLEILMCEKLVSVSPTRTTYREGFSSCHERETKKNFESPWGIEPQTFPPSDALLLNHRWHVSCIRVLAMLRCPC